MDSRRIGTLADYLRRDELGWHARPTVRFKLSRRRYSLRKRRSLRINVTDISHVIISSHDALALALAPRASPPDANLPPGFSLCEATTRTEMQPRTIESHLFKHFQETLKRAWARLRMGSVSLRME